MADTITTPAAASPVAKKLTATPPAAPKVAKVAKPAAAPKVAKPKPAKPAAAPKSAKPAPRVKVAATLGDTSLESRRAPLGDTLERAQALVAKFGGKGEVKIADAAAALGVEADEIKRRVKRLRSWFGPEAVTRKAGSIIVHVTK